jgi:RecG-like helicase
MPEEFKRHIANKIRIGDIFIGKPILENNRFRSLELGDKNIVRVNIVGNIIDKYNSNKEKKYLFFTLDDGSGQIKLRIFENPEKFENINQGETVLIIGVLRHWNNEIYIIPEIIKGLEPRYLLVRKIELEKEQGKNPAPVAKDQIIALKDKILDLVKNSENEGGIDSDQIIIKLRDDSPESINKEIHKLIEEGIIFEPRPGRVRYLG